MFHYSTPRSNYGPYRQVEVGFPSPAPPESWREYCDGEFDDSPSDTVYGYIPIELVVEFINEHGGMA